MKQVEDDPSITNRDCNLVQNDFNEPGIGVRPKKKLFLIKNRSCHTLTKALDIPKAMKQASIVRCI